MGKPLPELKDLRIELPGSDVSDKMILVCLFEMREGSRNCLKQLSTRAQELKTRGVVIVAAHASKFDVTKLRLIKEIAVSFPVGMIRDDVEKTMSAWGVRALPWLILTDCNHIVSAEGFALAELDEKIEAASRTGNTADE